MSTFCPNLQKLLNSTHGLTRKGKPFIWNKMQKDHFKEIKTRSLKPAVLNLPDNRGRFQLFSDTIKTAACSALYQIQNGTPKLIGYASRRFHLQQ